MGKSEKRILIEIFAVVMVFSLAGMVLGPFGYDKLSILASAVAIVLSLVGICYLLFNWKK